MMAFGSTACFDHTAEERKANPTSMYFQRNLPNFVDGTRLICKISLKFHGFDFTEYISCIIFSNFRRLPGIYRRVIMILQYVIIPKKTQQFVAADVYAAPGWKIRDDAGLHQEHSSHFLCRNWFC